MTFVIKEFSDKVFQTKAEMFRALKDNEHHLLAQKKMKTKECDSVCSIVLSPELKGSGVGKSTYTDEEIKSLNTLKVSLVINTTKIMDSHSDVHIDSLWSKSIKEQKGFYLLQQHKMTFENIIADSVVAKVSNVEWSNLGFDYPGKTQALIFNAEISKERNPFMFSQYAKGYVKEHSVGMRYVKYYLAMDSDSEYDVKNKAVWDKYIDDVANKQEAIDQGYFYAVTEAKIVEGSAVVKGSNHATPTMSVEAVSNTSAKSEPSNDTQRVSLIVSL